MSISENKLHHCVGVARYMYKKSLALGWSPSKAEEMFVLGWVHDIGYEFDTTGGTEHAHYGGQLLQGCSYRYWREVYCHGLPYSAIDDFIKQSGDRFDKAVFDLLNDADLHVDIDGKLVSLDERLTGLATRWGREHVFYRTAVELAMSTADWNPQLAEKHGR